MAQGMDGWKEEKEEDVRQTHRIYKIKRQKKKKRSKSPCRRFTGTEKKLYKKCISRALVSE